MDVLSRAAKLEIGGDFLVPCGGMVSAQGDAAAKTWYVATGKRRPIWLYHPDRSGVWCSGGPGSAGCGGNLVEFPLADGLGSIKLKGPWHSNADFFFRDTGIDVRSNFVTWGCVGTGRTYDNGVARITGLVWFDVAPTRGEYERVDHLAWELQEKNPDTKLFVYAESDGGSHHGPVSMPYALRVARGLQKPLEEIFGEDF